MRLLSKSSRKLVKTKRKKEVLLAPLSLQTQEFLINYPFSSDREELARYEERSNDGGCGFFEEMAEGAQELVDGNQSL